MVLHPLYEIAPKRKNLDRASNGFASSSSIKKNTFSTCQVSILVPTCDVKVCPSLLGKSVSLCSFIGQGNKEHDSTPQ